MMSVNQLTKSLQAVKGFQNDIPKQNLRALGGKSWRDCHNKFGYVALQRALLKDDLTSDHCIGDDEEYRSAIYSLIPGYMSLFNRMTLPLFRDDVNIKGLLKVYKKSKSQVSINALYTNTALYPRRILEREQMDIEPETKKLYWKHISDVYLVGFGRLESLDPELQEAVILSSLISNKNAGYDIMTKVKSKHYKKKLFAYVYRHLSLNFDMDEPLTVNVILKILKTAVARKFLEPAILFYRTHTTPKMRSVFGAGVIGKLCAALMKACKRMCADKLFDALSSGQITGDDLIMRRDVKDHELVNTDDRVPKIGQFMWVAWQEWSKLFRTIANRSRELYLKDSGDGFGIDFSKRLLSRGKKPRLIFLRKEQFEPGLEKSRTVRNYL